MILMARLIALQEEIELELRLLEREYDPFQMDLEWFTYELAIKIKRPEPDSAPGGGDSSRRQRHTGKGKINRKDLSILLAGLDELLDEGKDLRFEPYDLNFYMEWRLETQLVFSIVTWFDMALSPRNATSRFPSAHAGFRFLAEQDSIRTFRSDLEAECIGSKTAPGGEAPTLIN